DIQHRCVALLLEFRREDKLALGRRARSRGDRDILLAVELECHWWRGKAGPDIDPPQLLERGVVEGRDGAVQQCEEHKPAGGCQGPRIVRVREVQALLDLLSDRIDGGQVALVAAIDFVAAASSYVPALLAFCGYCRIVGHEFTGSHCRNVEELRFRA